MDVLDSKLLVQPFQWVLLLIWSRHNQCDHVKQTLRWTLVKFLDKSDTLKAAFVHLVTWILNKSKRPGLVNCRKHPPFFSSENSTTFSGGFPGHFEARDWAPDWFSTRHYAYFSHARTELFQPGRKKALSYKMGVVI